MKFYFYNDEERFINNSHLTGKTFFSLVKTPNEADFLFIPQSNTTDLIKDKDIILGKKIIYFNLTEPISFNSAKSFLSMCVELGVNTKDVLFHCTNHYLDNFNCIHKGLSVVDHLVKSQLDDGYELSQKFLKFIFINNTVRKPRALVLEELMSRNLFLNQTYITSNADKWYGNKNILKNTNLSKWFDRLRSPDYLDVHSHIPYKNDKDFQSVYKGAFFNFVIETFSDFGLDNNGYNSHLTEKTVRNFIYKTPFLLLTSSEYQIEVIKSLGFETYNHIFGFYINPNNVMETVINYVDIMESLSNVSTIEVKKFCQSGEVEDITNKNYKRVIELKNLDIHNIYAYIQRGEYENKNERLLYSNEPECRYGNSSILATI